MLTGTVRATKSWQIRHHGIYLLWVARRGNRLDTVDKLHHVSYQPSITALDGPAISSLLHLQFTPFLSFFWLQWPVPSSFTNGQLALSLSFFFFSYSCL